MEEVVSRHHHQRQEEQRQRAQQGRDVPNLGSVKGGLTVMEGGSSEVYLTSGPVRDYILSTLIWGIHHVAPCTMQILPDLQVP